MKKAILIFSLFLILFCGWAKETFFPDRTPHEEPIPASQGENTDFHPHRAPHRRGDHRHSRRYASARSEQGAGDGIQDFLCQQHVLPREGLYYVHR